MSVFRQKYYDCFSSFYDRFIAIHSSDKGENARAFLSGNAGLKRGECALDICTGTGSLLPHLGNKVKNRGIVVGIDFSYGMLSVARSKIGDSGTIFLIQANASCLPFKNGSFDSVTCSHAFYELNGETQDYCLREIARTMRPGRPFLLMEHDVPKNFLIRMLFYIRLLSMGAKKARAILYNERALLQNYFSSVELVHTSNSKSKLFICKG